MKTRREARRLALDVLYEAEIRGLLPLEAWELARSTGWDMASDGGEVPGVDSGASLRQGAAGYGTKLVAGVQEHNAAIDELIVRYADRWAIERMPVVDRTLLRIAIFELLWQPDVPVAVVINEAVELAKEYSTEDSGRFVNGLLGRIAEGEREPV